VSRDLAAGDEPISLAIEEALDAGTLYPQDFVIPSGSTIVTQAISSVAPTLRFPNGADTLAYCSIRVQPSWARHALAVQLRYTSNLAAGNSFTITLRAAGDSGVLISSYPLIGTVTLNLAEPGVANTPVAATEQFLVALPVTPIYEAIHVRVGRTVSDTATGNFELLALRWRVITQTR
jgi:hypothetical protein